MNGFLIWGISFFNESHQFLNIKDIFIDCKIEKDERDSYPIVVDSKNEIIWIPKLKKSKYDVQNRENCDIIFKCL